MQFYEEWINDTDSLQYIEYLDDLLIEISYAYDSIYPIRIDKDGIFHVHKLAIGKNWCQYKEHISKLKPGLYEELVQFFKIQVETNE